MDKNKKLRRRLAGLDSVELRRICGVSVRLTPLNRIFIIAGDEIAFPTLAHGDVFVTVPVPDKVKVYLRDKLKRQREIRQKFWANEPEVEFNYA